MMNGVWCVGYQEKCKTFKKHPNKTGEVEEPDDEPADAID